MSIPPAPHGLLVPVSDIEGGLRTGQWRHALPAEEADFEGRWGEPAVLLATLAAPADRRVDQYVSMNFVHDGVCILHSYSGQLLRVEQRVVVAPEDEDAPSEGCRAYSYTRAWIQLEGAEAPVVLDGLPGALAQKVHDHTAHYDCWNHTAAEWPCARWEHWLRAPVGELLPEARRHLRETAQALRLDAEVTEQGVATEPLAEATAPPSPASRPPGVAGGPPTPVPGPLQDDSPSAPSVETDPLPPTGLLVSIGGTHGPYREGEWRSAIRARLNELTRLWSEPAALTCTLAPNSSEYAEQAVTVRLVHEGRRRQASFTGRLVRIEQRVVRIGSVDEPGVRCHTRTWLELDEAAKPTVLDGLPSGLMRMLDDDPMRFRDIAQFEWPCSGWERWTFGESGGELDEARRHLEDIAGALSLQASIQEAPVRPEPRWDYREEPADLGRLRAKIAPDTPEGRLVARLAQGQPVAGVDFKDARLSGLDLYKACLDGAILDGADLRGTNLNRASLQGASLVGACLEDADLQFIDLSDARLGGASLCGADLSNAQLENADLRDCRLDGADLSHARLTRARLEGLALAEVDLAYAHFAGARLRGATLCAIDARWTGWRDADLSGATLTAVGLENASLDHAKLDHAHLRGCTIGPVEAQQCSLREAHFLSNTWKSPYFEDCDFTGADLQGEEVTGGSFLNCRLDEADLRRASITSAEFEGSSLRGADLRGADLSRNAMRGVPFDGARVEGLDLAHTGLDASSMEDDYLEETIVLSKPEFRPSGSEDAAASLLRAALEPVSAASRALPWADEHPGGEPWRLDRMVRIEGYRSQKDTRHRIATVDLHHLDLDLARQATLAVCGLLRDPQADIDAARLVVGSGARSRGYGAVLAPKLTLLLARTEGVIVRPNTQGAPKGWMDLIVPGKVVRVARPAPASPSISNKSRTPSAPGRPSPVPSSAHTARQAPDPPQPGDSKGWGWVVGLALLGTLLAPGLGTLVGAAVGWFLREARSD